MPKCHLCRCEYGDEATYCAQCGARVDDSEMADTLISSPEWATTEELLELSRALSSTLDLQLLLKKIGDSAGRLTEATAGSIMLFDEDKESLRFRSAFGAKAAIVRSLSVCDGIAWWVAQHRENARVDNAPDDKRFTGTIDRITGLKTRSLLCIPMILDDEVIGVIEVLNKANGTGFTEDDERLLSVMAGQAAVAVRNARLATEQRNFFAHVMEMFVMAIESTFLVFEGHCWRVAQLAIAIGQKLGMEDHDLQDLYYAAALHDLGLLGLGQAEIVTGIQMESLPILGANMVSTIDMLRGTESIIRHHREHFDGSGYPDSLEGESIPLGSRIIAVAEAHEEAMWKGKSQSSAKTEIQRDSGRLFDPVVVDAFLESITVDEY